MEGGETRWMEVKRGEDRKKGKRRIREEQKRRKNVIKSVILNTFKRHDEINKARNK